MSETSLHHIEHFANEIGPRGSTTDDERRAADYAAQHFERIGLEPCVEKFTSATSLYLFYMFVGLCFVAGFVIYPLAGRVSAIAAMLLGGMGLYSICMELLYRRNPIRWIQPKGQSQNQKTTRPIAQGRRNT